MRKGVLFLLILGSCLALRANNVQLQGMVKVVSATGSLVTMEVDLSWENSWRDDYNWDAVWLFFKYKVGVDGAWTHAAINTAGATVTGGDYTTMSGTTGTTAQGLFVYPDKDRSGNTGNLKVQIRWATSYTKAQFDNNDIFVVAHGIEMVYIPYNAYTIGDGSSTNSFAKKVIDSEAVYSTANAAFPKGYQGFYVMKYETSQEEYVEFLNTLTLAQQKALIPGIDALSIGDFVFGTNKKAANCRNGVVLSGKVAGKPLFFDNNLNNNKVYSEDADGGTLAMNYMSITDACGYASWAGLRPMTEMEYEKACRRPYPQEPEAGEFAWNSATGAVNAAGLTLQGSGREIAATGNVNAGATINGPVRCGIFARPSATTQVAVGATYWGVMEMSGNVAELCATIKNTTISRTINGAGAYNAALFGTDLTGYGTRGGGFSNMHTNLSTSDRSAISCFTSLLQRDSTVGFRCAFTYNAAWTVNAGTLADVADICPGDNVTFSGTPATVDGMKITSYIWSVRIGTGAFTFIPGEDSETLTYSIFTAHTTYVFKRKAVFPLGEAEVSTKTYRMPTITFSPTSAVIDACGNGTLITASGADSCSWTTPTGTLTGMTYTPKASDFRGPGTFPVTCAGTVAGCGVSKALFVTVRSSDYQTFKKCGDYLLDCQGNNYKTKQMADGRCWMTQNMRRTDVAYVYVNSASSAVAHGCVYSWNIAMQGSNTQGTWSICPVGWYIPSDSDWQGLVVNYDGYSIAGTALKNPTIFNMTLSGVGGTISFGTRGYYWSSSEIGTQARRHGVSNTDAVVIRDALAKTSRSSVRCIKNR